MLFIILLALPAHENLTKQQLTILPVLPAQYNMHTTMLLDILVELRVQTNFHTTLFNILLASYAHRIMLRILFNFLVSFIACAQDPSHNGTQCSCCIAWTEPLSTQMFYKHLLYAHKNVHIMLFSIQVTVHADKNVHNRLCITQVTLYAHKNVHIMLFSTQVTLHAHKNVHARLYNMQVTLHPHKNVHIIYK